MRPAPSKKPRQLRVATNNQPASPSPRPTPAKAKREAPQQNSPDTQLLLLAEQASTPQVAQEDRVKAGQSLCALLRSEEGSKIAPRIAVRLWPRLLGLLRDLSPAVRQNAAVAIGLMGAIAAKPGTIGSHVQGFSSSILFDWALPLLSESGNSDVGTQFWSLIALREGLVAMDLENIKRWAAALFEMCERLLDAEDTSPSLLQPLLAVVVQAARHTPALKARVRLLTDILLGWALDPTLPDAARPVLASTMISFQPGWPVQPEFTSELLTKLIGDTEQLVKSSKSPDSKMLRKFMGFSNCIAAISRVSAQALHGIFPGFPILFHRIIDSLSTGYEKLGHLSRSLDGLPTLQEELCLHVDTLMTIMLTMPTLSLGTHTTDATDAAQQAGLVYTSVMEFCLQLLSPSLGSVPGFQATLRLHLRLLQLLDHTKAEPKNINMLLASKSHFQALRHHSNVEIVQLAAKTYASLLLQFSLGIFQPVLAAIQRDVSELGRTANYLHGQEHENKQPTRPSDIENHKANPKYLELDVSFSLKALQAALASSSELQSEKSAVMQQLLWSFIRPDGDLLQFGYIHGQALIVLQSSSHSTRLEKAAVDVLAGLVNSAAAPTPSRLKALEWLQKSLATCQNPLQQSLDQHLLNTVDAGPPAEALGVGARTTSARIPANPIQAPGTAQKVVEELLPSNETTATPGLASLIWGALAAASQDNQACLRLAASRAILDALERYRILLDDDNRDLLHSLALDRLCDLTVEVQLNWEKILIEIVQSNQGEVEWQAVDTQRPWMSSLALKSQSDSFRPVHLTQLLGFLAGVKGAGSWDPGGHLPNHFLRIIASCQASSAATAGLAFREISSEVSAAWWVIQEAARHVVLARLRTSFGNPTQTLALLERALQQALATPQRKDPSELYYSHRHAWLLLEFIDAVERNIHNAAEGAVDRQEPSPPVMAFFAGNRKVCEEWFNRMRPLLLRLSHATAKHTSTIGHAYTLLNMLKVQMRTFLAEPRPAEAEDHAKGSLPSSVDIKPKVLVRRSEPGKELAEDPRLFLPPMQRLLHSFISTVQKAALALAAEKDAAGLAGLHSYCLHAFGPLPQLLKRENAALDIRMSDLVSWILPMQRQATGHLEGTPQAFKDILARLDDMDACMPDETTAFVVAQASQAYTDLADWDGLEAFFEFLEKLKQGARNKDRSAAAFHLPSQTANKHLSLMSLDRRDVTTAQALLDLSGWSDVGLQQHPKPLLVTKPTSIAQAGVLKSVLAVLGKEEPGASRWQKVIKPAADMAKAASIAELRLETLVGGEVRSSRVSWLSMLLQLEDYAGLPASETSEASSVQLLEACQTHLLGSTYEHSVQLDVRPIHLRVIGDTMPAEISWSARTSLAIDPDVEKGSSLARLLFLSRQTASLGNADQAARILDIAQESALLKADLAMRQCADLLSLSHQLQVQEKRGEAMAKLTGTVRDDLELETWHQQDIGTRSMSAIACIELAALVGSDDTEQHDSMDPTEAQLGEYSDLHQLCSPLQRTQLFLLQAATKQAPHLALGWAALSNWLHARLAEGELEEDSKASHLMELAIRASCQRLRSASLGSREHLAAPELLRVLKLVEMSESPSAVAEALQVPVGLWQAIVPQLFSLLDSTREQLSALASQLLQSLEEIIPAAVLYPALAEGISKSDSALAQLVARYRKRSPLALSQLESMISEFGSLTVLLHEECHNGLLDIQAEISKRVSTIQVESERISDKDNLSEQDKLRIMQERFVAIMAPAGVKLQRLLVLPRLQTPKSPYEMQFKQHFYGRIMAAVTVLQAPDEAIVVNPERVMSLLKNLTYSVGRFISETAMQLATLSPLLSTMDSIEIPMPMLSGNLATTAVAGTAAVGQGATQITNSSLTVSAFGANVELLKTRTRPKKIQLVASDGRSCTFLLKGQEDLRLEERLLQLTLLIGGILRHDPETSASRLKVRRFAVTPLGSRVGLIEWVENTRPLYQIVNSWQKFGADRLTLVKAEQESKAAPRDAKSKASKHLPTAIDNFYAKLVPALEAAGIDRLAMRKDWPLEVLKQVLGSLMREVPCNLLEQQIWSGSASSWDWWRRQKEHSRSTAVMSMVGYLMGLGDRHLDNILMDSRTAELVHIDYNIIFERGRKLPVPELVPFRLTQVIKGALGPTGVEGTFRLSCQAVLTSLRRNSQAVCLLMEAILYDPLVDWVPNREDAAANQAMELGVRLNLLCSRVDEVMPAVQMFLADFMESLATVQDPFSNFLEAFRPALDTASIAHNANLQAEAAKKRIAEATEGLQSEWHRAQAAAAERSEAMGLLEQTRVNASGMFASLQADSESMASAFIRLRGGTAEELQLNSEGWVSSQSKAPLGLMEEHMSLGSSILVKVNISTSLQQVVQECQAADEQGALCLQTRESALSACLDVLQEYAKVASNLLDETYWQTSFTHQWAVALQVMLEKQVIESSSWLAPQASDAYVQASWQALTHAEKIWSRYRHPDLEGQTPIAILRADANAASREVSMLDFTNTEATRLAQALIVHSCLSRISQPFNPPPPPPQIADSRQPWMESLRVALETLALLTAPGNASPSFQGAQDLKGRIQGCVASIVALNTVWEVGRAAYLPELEGYARTDFSLSDKGMGAELHSYCIRSDAIVAEAFEMDLQQASIIDSLTFRTQGLTLDTTALDATRPGGEQSGLESTLQDMASRQRAQGQRMEEIVADFKRLMNGLGGDGSGSGTVVAGLSGTLHALYSLINKMQAPLRAIAQEAWGNALPPNLRHLAFDIYCIRGLGRIQTACCITPTESGVDTVDSAAEALLKSYSNVLVTLLTDLILPSLKHSLGALQAFRTPELSPSVQNMDLLESTGSAWKKRQDDEWLSRASNMLQGNLADASIFTECGHCSDVTQLAKEVSLQLRAASESGMVDSLSQGNGEAHRANNSMTENRQITSLPNTVATFERLAVALDKLCKAKSALQQVEYRASATEVGGVANERRVWATRQQAICEWLLPQLYDRAVNADRSKLDLMNKQGLLEARVSSREVLVRSLHSTVSQLNSAEDEVDAWRGQVSIPAEKNIYKAVQKADKTQLALVKGQLALREKWLLDSKKYASKVLEAGHSILSLEASRDGHVWKDRSLQANAFDHHWPVMSALDKHFQDMYSADAIVADARQQSEVLQEVAEAATREVATCLEQATDAGSRFVSLANDLMKASCTLPDALTSLLSFSGQSRQTFEDATALLQEVCKICKGKEMLRDLQGRASRLHGLGVDIGQALQSLVALLPRLAAGLEAIGLPSETQVQQMLISSQSQELSAGAAAIIDTVIPIQQDIGFDQWPDLAAVSSQVQNLQADLRILRAHISAAAHSVQQEHMPVLDQSDGNAKGIKASSETADPEAKAANQETSSKDSTQQSAARSFPPVLASSAILDSEASASATPNALSLGSQAPHGLVVPKPGEPGFSLQRTRSPFKPPQAFGSDSQGLAAVEQVGKARIAGREPAIRGPEKRQEEREHARKAFAAATMRRFKIKLEGLTEKGPRTPEGRRIATLTVPEQVEKLLQQASSIDNLARMYEGWTPWI